MSMIIVSSVDAGAPTMAAVNGRLCEVLDWALVKKGWTIKFSSGFARVYESVNGRLLHVNHDSAVSGNVAKAVVRGCEGASSATALVDPYPAVSAMSNANATWTVRTGGYSVYIFDDFFYLVAAGRTEIFWFGNVPTQFDDTYACAVYVENSASFASVDRSFSANSVGFNNSASACVRWMRNVDGSIKDTFGPLALQFRSFSYSWQPAARSGYQNRVFREKVPLGDTGYTGQGVGAMALHARGYLPNLWSGVHNGQGGISQDDTFTDTAYNPSAVFRARGNYIFEESDTWEVP